MGSSYLIIKSIAELGPVRLPGGNGNKFGFKFNINGQNTVHMGKKIHLGRVR